MAWGYQPFNMISLWNPWAEQSSRLSLSCGTKEPITCNQLSMTSTGSSKTLWIWLGSCWPVWQLLQLSSESVVCFVASILLAQKRRGKETRCFWDIKLVCHINRTLHAYLSRRNYDNILLLLWQNINFTFKGLSTWLRIMFFRGKILIKN